MASRHSKMYDDSPSIKRGEDGKHKVERKKSAAKPKADMSDRKTRHLREIEEMHKRHIDEHKALAARQQKEEEAETDAGAPPAADANGAEEPGATM